jgi:hypothetical protein
LRARWGSLKSEEKKNKAERHNLTFTKSGKVSMGKIIIF